MTRPPPDPTRRRALALVGGLAALPLVSAASARGGNPGRPGTLPPRPHEAAQGVTMSEPTPPTMPYWHVYTDGDGVSRQVQCELSQFKFEGVDPQTAPQWNDKQEKSQAGVTFTVLPVGWVGEWHENPRPQWIAILSGRWFVETMDGVRVEMGPGELMMGEDQGTKERDGKKGHLSGTVGDEPCTMIVTGLEVTPTVNQPGRFK